MDTVYNGFRREDFKFEGRDAIIVYPDEAEPGKRWMLKMEYFDAFPGLELELVRRGWHLLFLENINRWGTDEDSDAKARFVSFVSERYGLIDKCVCVGMSCGGLCSVNFAARHPKCVSFLYLDAPVMNLLSCPMGLGVGTALGGWDSAMGELRDAYGLDISGLLLYRDHPVDRIPGLTEYRIPAALIYGEADDVVPYIENGIALERAYREKGIPLFCVGKPGCGHHPHGLEDPVPLADFIEKHT